MLLKTYGLVVFSFPLVAVLFPPANGRCPLVTYNNSSVSLGSSPNCLEPFPLKIAEDFLPTFKSLVKWSKQCRVKMIICRSFRKSSFPIAPNAFREDLNHFVGHAVDINLITTKGYCGEFCLYRKLHQGARCFLRKIKLKKLRWGGDTPNFCAPTQIDDALFESDPDRGNFLLRQISNECDYFGYVDL